ncbi:MAG: hypothetical protein JW723_10775 [Bacteroidales bacterium]|nr:hypothetical protein [Bacteroidales bacterium]
MKDAAELIKHSSRTVAYTEAGISVESGIPPFRGENGLLHTIITQNIDNLNQEAGSKLVVEFHGNFRILLCQKCLQYYLVKATSIMQQLLFELTGLKV